MTPKVNVLMSTYNGEKYIIEQLDSIFEQTYQNFKLIIRDDGSKDSTESIIQEYKENLPKQQADKICILPNVKKENWGYIKSFWTLLEISSEADYYAFCDQDDIWLPNKIEKGIEALSKEKINMPVLYTSRFDYYSGDMKFQQHGINYPYEITFDKVAFYTPAFGFTIMFNECLRKIALSCKDLTDVPHDGWCLKIASSMGKIVYDSTITAKYRRYESNVTYASASKFVLIKKWLINDIFRGNLQARYWLLFRFYEEYGNKLNPKDKKFIYLFGQKDGKVKIIKRIKRLCYPQRLRPTLGGEVALRICFLLGK